MAQNRPFQLRDCLGRHCPPPAAAVGKHSCSTRHPLGWVTKSGGHPETGGRSPAPQHTNIVRCLGLRRLPGFYHICLEYCSAGSLRRWGPLRVCLMAASSSNPIHNPAVKDIIVLLLTYYLLMYHRYLLGLIILVTSASAVIISVTAKTATTMIYALLIHPGFILNTRCFFCLNH